MSIFIDFHKPRLINVIIWKKFYQLHIPQLFSLIFHSVLLEICSFFRNPLQLSIPTHPTSHLKKSPKVPHPSLPSLPTPQLQRDSGKIRAAEQSSANQLPYEHNMWLRWQQNLPCRVQRTKLPLTAQTCPEAQQFSELPDRLVCSMTTFRRPPSQDGLGSN